jgi:hypothetical protein
MIPERENQYIEFKQEAVSASELAEEVVASAHAEMSSFGTATWNRSGVSMQETQPRNSRITRKQRRGVWLRG